MKKTILFKNLRKNNKGSALVTVIVSMIFVMALGAALLFSTYMSYKIALSQRRSTEAFYTAESMADDIRFGLQTEATRALTIAYTETMTEYVKTTNTSFDTQTNFANAFEREMLDAKGGSIFSKDGAGCAYNAKALSVYVNIPKGGTFSLGSGGSFEDPDTAIGEVLTFYDVDSKGELRLTKLCLLKLGLRYTREDGYESRIITDITINVPSFSYDDLGSYAIVADKGIIKNSGGESRISGKVYAGSLSISGNGNSLEHNGGDLIVKGTKSDTNGTVCVSKGASFAFGGTSEIGGELWAGELIAEEKGSLKTSGRAYVADDLILGAGGKAELSGSYFGFGSSFSNPNQSSAIIVNGEGASLDISLLNRLSLAGISFIDVFGGELYKDSEGEITPPVPMGESLSVKTNQLAYLVPVECIKNYAGNPFIFDSDEGFNSDYIDMNTVLWEGNPEKTLNSYLAGGKGEIITLYKNIDSETKLVYVFLQFSNQKYANEYFQDYFGAYPDRISEYMKFYLKELSDKADGADINSAGNAFYMKNSGLNEEKLTLVSASDSLWSESLQSRFNMFSSPFSRFVNSEKLNKLSSGKKLEFYDNDHNLVAIVAKGECANSLAGEGLRLIIASGDVEISGNFEGTVLTEGQLTLKGNIKGQPLCEGILEAATKDGAYTLGDFITFGPESDNLWSPERLVYYENWTKN
ncbi:MAG: hypothetical protein GX025_05065 [Clostridiales bacterium]|nr:hypothetical protein [Clostridiales bacterium]